MATELSSGGARRRCVVIGGGYAGLAAACELADRGAAVTLIERRHYLGGRSFSFPDPVSGRHLDNGAHIYLTCCTAYTGFLQRLGTLERTLLQPRLRAVVQGRNGRRGIMTPFPLLPAPLHLLPSLLTYPHMSLLEKLRLMSAVVSVLRTDRERHREALEAESFQAWLQRRKQSPRAISAFWDLLTLPVFNDLADGVSAYMGLLFFQEGLLASRHSADLGVNTIGLTELGVNTIGLTELGGEAAQRYIEARGGEVRTGRTVTALTFDEGAVTGVVVDGAHVPADAVITAMPWDALLRLLPEELAGQPPFTDAAAMEWSPIINVHVWYDRPVVDQQFMGILDSPAQWLFDLTSVEGLEGPEQHIGISVSGAYEYVNMPLEALRELFLSEMRLAFPAAAQAKVERFKVVRQIHATFRNPPGMQARRPSQRTPIPGLTLAGDWTQTGWPSTMESAVRSGLLAAEVVAESWAADGSA